MKRPSWYREYWVAPHVVVWRMIWFVPAQIARTLFVITVFCGWGYDSADRAWKETG